MAYYYQHDCLIEKILERMIVARQEKCLDKVQGDRESFIAKVRNALNKMYQDHGFQALEEGIQDIAYQDPFFQFGYLYKLCMFSARSLSKVIFSSRAMMDVRVQPSISVACLGGGPGSDVLGVLDYFLTYMKGYRGMLNIQLYDREDKWGACWASLKKAIAEVLRDPRVTVTVHDFDVTTADKNKLDLGNADIITMHYFMEEVYSEMNNPNVVQSFHHILHTARPGALFLYSGMYMRQAINWVHELLTVYCCLLTAGTRPPYKWTDGHPQYIPFIEVDLTNEEDLRLFENITSDLEMYYPIWEISQRYHGDVVYRLYRK